MQYITSFHFHLNCSFISVRPTDTNSDPEKDGAYSHWYESLAVPSDGVCIVYIGTYMRGEFTSDIVFTRFLPDTFE